jgi:hypothetical protein
MTKIPADELYEKILECLPKTLKSDRSYQPNTIRKFYYPAYYLHISIDLSTYYAYMSKSVKGKREIPLCVTGFKYDD